MILPQERSDTLNRDACCGYVVLQLLVNLDMISNDTYNFQKDMVNHYSDFT